MSNKKQTAVEWLIEKLKSQGLLIGEPDNLIAVKQAKEMEKQQIKEACNQGYYDGYKDNGNNPEQYYKETYDK
jgi:hypothetical protein